MLIFFLFFSFAVAIVIASLAGPQWLLTEEKLPNTNYNGTANFNVIDDGLYITKHTKSSLWILCASQGNFYNKTHFKEGIGILNVLEYRKFHQ